MGKKPWMENKGEGHILCTSYSESPAELFSLLPPASLWMCHKYRHCCQYWKMLTKIQKNNARFRVENRTLQQPGVSPMCSWAAWVGSPGDQSTESWEENGVNSSVASTLSAPGPVSLASFSAGSGHAPSAYPWPSVPSPPLPLQPSSHFWAPYQAVQLLIHPVLADLFCFVV